MGQGRVLLQEMALVKPPKCSGEKPWHQDAAYFRGSDPNLMALSSDRPGLDFAGDASGLYHGADGEYAGCTVAKGAPFAEASSHVPRRLRAVVPMA